MLPSPQQAVLVTAKLARSSACLSGLILKHASDRKFRIAVQIATVTVNAILCQWNIKITGPQQTQERIRHNRTRTDDHNVRINSPYIKSRRTKPYAVKRSRNSRSRDQHLCRPVCFVPAGTKYKGWDLLAVVDPLAKFKECSFIHSRNIEGG